MPRGAYESRERWVIDREALTYAMRRARVASTTELACVAGLGYDTVAKLRSGAVTRPSAATLCSLAVALGVDALDLMQEVAQ